MYFENQTHRKAPFIKIIFMANPQIMTVFIISKYVYIRKVNGNMHYYEWENWMFHPKLISKIVPRKSLLKK